MIPTIVHINNGNTNVFRTVAQAEALVATLRADDPDTSYTVVVDPIGTGKATIAIHDEDGIFVATL